MTKIAFPITYGWLVTIYNPAQVGWFRCFRGHRHAERSAFVLAELHDVQRFPTARALMAHLGLVPRGAFQR